MVVLGFAPGHPVEIQRKNQKQEVRRKKSMIESSFCDLKISFIKKIKHVFLAFILVL